MPTITTQRTEPYRFLPEGFNAADKGEVAKLYDDLDNQEVSTREELVSFIHNWEELNAVITERYNSAYIDMTAETENQDYADKYIQILEDILPVAEKRNFKLKEKVLASPAVDKLGEDYDVFLRNIRSEVALFRSENVPLFTEDQKMGQEYGKISGAQKAEIQGTTYTMPQIAKFLEETDRPTREEAWRARAEAKLADAVVLDALYDRMYEVRQQIAHNAGFDNYRDYKFAELRRFDYTPEDCMAFHDAIETHVVPVVIKEQERRKRLMGLETLRPWDLQVDPQGYPPLRPFEGAARLQEGAERVVRKVDKELAGYFRAMIDQGLLDLDNRPGKAQGGYQINLPDSRVPFIFMNAVGTKRDVDTMLHEGGHAFHYFLSQKLPLYSYHETGSEMAEVASMSMELLARPYLGEFYKKDELERLLDDQIRSTLDFFPFMAMIDSFQQWVYTAEEAGAEARRAKWAELEARFRPGIDWSGLEQYRDVGWQYLHVFEVPLYYVEYGIAQLAALRIWLNSLKDEKKAIGDYKKGLALGGSRPLPELYKAVGADFAFNDKVVSKIIQGALAQMGKKE